MKIPHKTGNYFCHGFACSNDIQRKWALVISIIVLAPFFRAQFVLAQDTIYFKNDTTIWTIGPKIGLMADSAVLLDNNDKIISGFIYKEQYLWTATRLIKFKAGSEIKFDDNGNVKSGILAEKITLKTTGAYVAFKSNSKIYFNETGKVTQGFLLRNTIFQNNGTSILFKAGTFIRFGIIGNVIKGTLAERKNLDCNDGKSHVFKPGDSIKFNDELLVIVQNKQ